MSSATELVEPGTGPEVSSARELSDLAGGSAVGYQKLVAHSQLRLAFARCGGDFSDADRQTRRMATEAKRTLAAYQKAVFGGAKSLGVNDQLRKDEWKQMDDALTAVARDNTIGIDTLRERGITVPLDLGTLRFEWEDISDFSAADVDMAVTGGGNEDTFKFTNNGIPLPIVHKGFTLNLRRLRASRNRGQPLDTVGVEAATEAVSRKLEDILFGGNTITVDGDSISGATGFTDRETVSGNATWDGASADNMVDDIMRTVNALEDAKALPGRTGYDTFIARQNYQELRAKNSGTDDKRGVLELIRDRLQGEEDLPAEVRFFPSDRISDGNAVMVKPDSRYLQLPMAADIQTVAWESLGGLVQHWKVIGSVFPAWRSDQSANSGVAHLSSI